ncbi:ribonuclease H [Puteibacter caeruleilacunae]|nr:ribonuclease H [Puteibacter caeruleilacunae]
MAKKKYYVVWVGRKTGVFETWDECKRQVEGCAGAKYKSFPSMKEAQEAFDKNSEDYIVRGKSTKSKSVDLSEEAVVWDSVSVDAACSGNPGAMEYQGVDTKTGAQWFHVKYSLGTNNIGEFLAIVHALALFKQRNVKLPLYTDSRIAMTWVKNKKCKTKLEKNRTTAKLLDDVERAEKWLQNNSYTTKIMKWNTKEWGEIPADFGRK